MYKVDCEDKVTCLQFFLKFTKMELADDITERCHRYKMNKIKCFSPISSHYIILKITQCYSSSLKVLHLVPHMRGEL